MYLVAVVLLLLILQILRILECLVAVVLLLLMRSRSQPQTGEVFPEALHPPLPLSLNLWKVTGS